MISANLRRGGRHAIDIGDNVQNSLMLDSKAGQHLTNSMGASGTSGQLVSIDIQVKRGKLGTTQSLFFVDSGVAWYSTELLFNTSDQLQLLTHYGGSGTQYGWITSRVFRDPSAWIHIHIQIDTSINGQQSRRLWINGVEEFAFTAGVSGYNTAGMSTYYLGPYAHRMGSNTSGFDGYISRFIAVNAQTLDATYFGRTSIDTGAWVNKNYTGTYGDNGFKLEFLNGASLGTDTSGNGNHFTLNGGIVAANQFIDTPTNNFCVLNNVIRPYVGSDSISRGNTTSNNISGTVTGSAWSTVPMKSGKWYAEVTVSTVGTSRIGVSNNLLQAALGTYNAALFSDGYCYNMDGNKTINGTPSAYGATYANGDVIGIALNLDASEITFYKNGVSQGVAASGISSDSGMVFGSSGASGAIHLFNFGARAFSYTPPTGFKALCTANLTQPSIIRPAKHFKAKTRTGTAVAANITGIEFSPDLIWIKCRSSSGLGHRLVDSIRGVTKALKSHATDAEVIDAQGVTAFNSDGFSVGSAIDYNNDTNTFIDWMWDRGVIPGFDIVGYLATGVSGSLLPHSLGVSPKVVLIKARDGVASSWIFGSESIGWGYRLYLESIAAKVSDNTVWLSTPPDSSNVTLGGFQGLNTAGVNYVAYLFAEVDGFSKFGSYLGNGSTDGPFIHCGFRPAFLLWKRTDTTSSWFIFDTSRSSINIMGNELYADQPSIEAAVPRMDFLSNGFKLRAANAGDNASAGIYIFMAFAEMPFKYSNAR